MRGRRLAYALIAEPCEPEIDAARLKYRAALADQIARLVRRGIESGEFVQIEPNVAASCVTGAFMEALVGPLAPEADPDSDGASNLLEFLSGTNPTQAGDAWSIHVLADSNQLLQVFSHIINNAVNAMSERGGTLTVSTRSEGELIAIQFADTGPGMAEPDRVFDPFYTTRPVGQGIGLGLSACYGIIQQHGGKISGRNGETGGAIFQIDLPAVSQIAGTEFAQAHAASKPS